MSGLVDRGSVQMTSLPSSLKRGKGSFFAVVFIVFSHWKSSKCKKSLLFLFRIVQLSVLC